MTMSNTMICGATKIWYYIPERKSAAFEAWLEATRPGYIENLETGRCTAMPWIASLICSPDTSQDSGMCALWSQH